MLLFNRYEYNPQSDMIGRGGFSRVYRAQDKKLNRTVALKVYKNRDIADKYSPIAEIQRVVDLDHPNIARYLDIEESEKENAFGETERMQVCVMEFLDGGNLAQYYASDKDLIIFKKLLIDVLNGLAYLHQNDIIHRDIKPGNILIKKLVKGPVAKITDFGISKHSDSSYNSTSSALIVSIPYMAPEQLNVHKYGIKENISFNIDLWALGVAVYEILSGEMLFKNSPQDSSEQIMTNIMLPDVPSKVNDLPQPFKDFVNRCVVKDAKERVQNPEDLITLLQTATVSPLRSEDTYSPVPAAFNQEEGYTGNSAAITDNVPAPDVEMSAEQPGSDHEDTSDDQDNTVILPKEVVAAYAENKQADDTVILPKAKVEAVAENNQPDDTQILSERPRIPEETEDENETKVIRIDNVDLKAGDESDTIVVFKKFLPADADETTILKTSDNPADEKDPDAVQVPAPSGTNTNETVIRKEKPVNLFNRYDYFPLADLIGKGGFSRVYKAYDKKLNRWVALKIYKTGEFSERYSPIAEIRRVVNLDHPNICRYLDIEEIEKENPFGENEITQICVMELLDSGNLSEYYKKNKSQEVFKKLLHDILNGLAYLHRHGIIHRDIKPQNILIKSTLEGPIAKITDFGISKASDNVNNNSTSALVVSIPYMAPEQLNIRKYGIDEKISFNLDLWSLGVTVYEIITGNVLFKNSEQDSSEQIMTNIMAAGIPEKINELPTPFREIVSRCVVKNARERAQKAEDLLKFLEQHPEPVVPVIQEQPIELPGATNLTSFTKSKGIFLDEEQGSAEKKKEKEIKQPVNARVVQMTNGKDVFLRKHFSKLVAGLVLVILLVPVLIFWHPWNYAKAEMKAGPVTAAKDTTKDVAAKVVAADPAKNDSLKVPGTKITPKEDNPPVVKQVAKKSQAEAGKTESVKSYVDIPVSGSTERISFRIQSAKPCRIKIYDGPDEPVTGTIKGNSFRDVVIRPGQYIIEVTNLTDTTQVMKYKLPIRPSTEGKRNTYMIRW